MKRCCSCRGLLLFRKKLYGYRGKRKGDLSLAPEKVFCKKCFEKEFPVEEKDEDVFVEIGVLMAKKDDEGALKLLESSFDKNSAADWYSKGSLLFGMRKYKLAIPALDNAIFLDTHYVKAWYKKGWALVELGKYEDAIACFSNVLELENNYDPDNWFAAALFSAFMASVMNHNNYVKKKAPKKKFEETLTNIFKYKEYLPSILFRGYGIMLPAELVSGEDIGGLYDYCFNNITKILDELEPSVLVTISVPGMKH